MANELVSIVLCTYNGIKFIAPQLLSIQKQTYNPLEIIIVDDASKDGTYEWLQEEAETDKRIRLHKNEFNIGFNLNFNKACKMATGVYVAIADQDDIWEHKKISILVSAIKEKSDTMLVHCISARFEIEGKLHLKSTKLINHFTGNDVRHFFLENFISGHNILIKKQLLDESIPFPKEGYYDWWLVVKACCAGRIEAVEKILVWHRIHDANATGNAKRKMLFHQQTQALCPVSYL